MAAGTVVVFDQFLQDVGRKVHQLETDVIKLGLITSAVTPAANTADPRWGAGGTTNFSTNEVTPGGNYAAGGPDISATYSQAAGVATFDAADVTIAVNGANPNNARWGIGYNSTSVGKECVFFIDLGSVLDLSIGTLQIVWNGSGIFTIS